MNFKWPLITSGIFLGAVYIYNRDKNIPQLGQLGILTVAVFLALITSRYASMFPFNTLPQLGTLSWVNGAIVSVDVTTQHLFYIMMVLVGIMIGVYYKRVKDGLIDSIWEDAYDTLRG